MGGRPGEKGKGKKEKGERKRDFGNQLDHKHHSLFTGEGMGSEAGRGNFQGGDVV